MLSNRYCRRALRGLASVSLVMLASLALSSAVASAKPQPTFDASCAAYVDNTQITSATWSGLHVKSIDLTWYDSNGGVNSFLRTSQVKGGTFTWPTPYGAATVTVIFYSGGPGKDGSPVDTETRTCS